jgi:hypothetical protein
MRVEWKLQFPGQAAYERVPSVFLGGGKAGSGELVVARVGGAMMVAAQAEGKLTAWRCPDGDCPPKVPTKSVKPAVVERFLEEAREARPEVPTDETTLRGAWKGALVFEADDNGDNEVVSLQFMRKVNYGAMIVYSDGSKWNWLVSVTPRGWQADAARQLNGTCKKYSDAFAKASETLHTFVGDACTVRDTSRRPAATEGRQTGRRSADVRARQGRLTPLSRKRVREQTRGTQTHYVEVASPPADVRRALRSNPAVSASDYARMSIRSIRTNPNATRVVASPELFQRLVAVFDGYDMRELPKPARKTRKKATRAAKAPPKPKKKAATARQPSPPARPAAKRAPPRKRAPATPRGATTAAAASTSCSPPAGYTPIPGDKHGGHRKRSYGAGNVGGYLHWWPPSFDLIAATVLHSKQEERFATAGTPALGDAVQVWFLQDKDLRAWMKRGFCASTPNCIIGVVVPSTKVTPRDSVATLQVLGNKRGLPLVELVPRPDHGDHVLQVHGRDGRGVTTGHPVEFRRAADSGSVPLWKVHAFAARALRAMISRQRNEATARSAALTESSLLTYLAETGDEVTVNALAYAFPHVPRETITGLVRKLVNAGKLVRFGMRYSLPSAATTAEGWS